MPPTRKDWALFLDVDGTLIEIAATPYAVQVSPDLPPLLEQLRGSLDGALALISGRSIAGLDALFHPYRFPAAGIHGIERRDAHGEMHFSGLTSEDLEPARAELGRFVAQHPGLLLEDKGRSLAVHFRQAPQLESRVREAVLAVQPLLPAPTHVQPGHCVLEIKSGAANKRTAIERFLQEPPYAGRLPVFIGDDLTDFDGFELVESAGGHAIFVGPEPQQGRGWLPGPAAVREWLRSLLA